ncbi:hypothetical protein [Streptomyces sp. NRRL B-24720]|uniref:hypothetical protein n=1 Tax=Streptomyces sp. NRRL B-24720 TaxID=1476876 RepID=UPI00131B6B1D|nr:hypothetical protein [Streptomyces sp. NRRL B-24720]
MSWIAPLFTLLGVVLGTGASALADRRRWRRDEHTRARELRIAMYAEYLTAMEATAQALWNVLRHVPDSERPAAAEGAFTAFDLGAIRQRMHVLAPNDVRAAGETVFRSLRRSRDYVAVTDPHDHEQLNRLKHEVAQARNELQSRMRHDIDSPA